jgi:hypothetical protein
MIISAEIKKEDIDNVLKKFSSSLVRKAIRSAVDRTGTWGKNYIAEDVGANYNIPITKVKSAIKVERTRENSLASKIHISSQRKPLMEHFRAWQDSVGVKVAARKGTPYSYPHAFINVVTGYKKHEVAEELYLKRGDIVKGPTSIRPMAIEWKRKKKQLNKRLKALKMAGKPGKAVIMMRVGKERYPTTGKPGRGMGIMELANRLPNREKRDNALLNHLYKELAEQIAKRSLQQVPISELE